MKDKDLCKWLRDNSSGAYRKSAIAADRVETLLEWINREGERNNICTKISLVKSVDIVSARTKSHNTILNEQYKYRQVYIYTV